jgi:hypothetical protein
MAAVVRAYEFSFDTPQPDDPEGNSVPAIGTSFTLGAGGGITDAVAKGIRAGLRNVASITNVTAARVTEDRASVT